MKVVLSVHVIDQFQYIKIQPDAIDLSTMLWGIISPKVLCSYSPDSYTEFYCIKPTFNKIGLLLTYWNVETSYFQDLQATFRQTLTESAYILKSQATFLGKCINQARPYYDAVRKAKQVRNFVSSLFAAELLENLDFCKCRWVRESFRIKIPEYTGKTDHKNSRDS